MIAALVLASLAGLLVLTLPRRPGRSNEPSPPQPATRPNPASPDPTEYPESMTAELDPWDEEYLAFLANELWPDDEYLDALDPDNEPEGGPGPCR